MEIIAEGFLFRTTSRILDLEKNPIVSEETDSEGWEPYTYRSGKSAGINPMLYTSESKARIAGFRYHNDNNNLYPEYAYPKDAKGNYLLDKDKRMIKNHIGYRERKSEIVPAKLILSAVD